MSRPDGRSRWHTADILHPLPFVETGRERWNWTLVLGQQANQTSHKLATPAPTFPAGVVWEPAEDKCGVTFNLKHNDWFSTKWQVWSNWLLFIRHPDAIRNSTGMSQGWGPVAVFYLGAAQCLHILWRGKGILTKQPFSATSITVTRLCYLQVMIGQTIFIEQFCFYSLSGNFCRPWLKDLAFASHVHLFLKRSLPFLELSLVSP